jgi:GTPase
MRIHQLLSGIDIPLSNEENKFVETHDRHVKLTSLDEHDQWLAQSLVRKGIYSISKDNVTLTKNINEKRT